MNPTTEDTMTTEESLLSLRFTSCGLNADWCVSAWHVGDNKPNTVSGDIYVIEDEDAYPELARFLVVQRTYTEDEDIDDKDLAGPLTAEDAILTCEYYTMTDTTKRTP